MLRELRIRDVAIIDDLSLTFGPGLNVISGETGAGKSILLQSLALLCGARGNAELIRDGAESASVDGLFECTLPEELAEALALEPEGDVLVRRVLTRSGKGRIHVNGSPATLPLLNQLGDHLVNIYGQHDQALLLRPAAHRALLDAYAGLTEAAHRMRTAHATWSAARSHREALARAALTLDERRELLALRYCELSEAAVAPGEEATLRAERELLRHAERLESVCRGGEAMLYSGQGAMVAALGRLHTQLSELTGIADRLGGIAELVDAGRVQLEEAALQLRAFAERLDNDPARLATIEDRLALLQRLGRKFDCAIDALPAALAAIERDLDALTGTAHDLEGAAAAEAAAHEAALAVARELSTAREHAARELEQRMVGELAALGMAGSRFQVAQSADSAQLAEHGIDQIEFLLAANPGEPVHPLARVASGGELSRIMLSLKALTAAIGETPILIFDEVDAGIGGEVAVAVARRLKALARNRQLLCITHLAQIAAYADQHVAVEKRERNGRTVTAARVLGSSERVAEVSRMLGGSAAPAEAERYAKRLLAEARAAAPIAEP